MKITEINQYIYLLNDLYFGFTIECTTEIYFNIKRFNDDYDEKKIKEAVFTFFEWMLSDGSHEFPFNNVIYSKANKNWEEFLEIYSRSYDELVELINNGATMGSTEQYNKVIERNVYYKLSEDWKNELCKLSKLGYRSQKENCQFNPNYQYQMPVHRFIPDNDCECEE